MEGWGKRLAKSVVEVIFVLVALLTLAMICLLVGKEIYDYNSYELRVVYQSPEYMHYIYPQSKNLEIPYFGLNSTVHVSKIKNRNGNPYPMRYDLLIQEFNDKVVSYQNMLYEIYDGPADVRATVENIDGHTVFTYQGTVTSKTGETVTIDEKITLSGILTEDLPQPMP